MKIYLNESLSAQERAEALVNEMTVEEAASQLRYASCHRSDQCGKTKE